MINKQFLINFFSGFLSMFISVGIGFLLTPYLVRNLGVKVYGFFPLANNIIAYSAIISAALNSMGGRYIILSIQKNEREKARTYFNTLFFSNFLLALFLFLVGNVFTYFIQSLLDVPSDKLNDVKLLFYIMILNLAISLIISVFSVGATSVNRLEINSSRNIISSIIKGLLLFALFYLFPPHLYYIGIATIVSTIFLGYFNFKILNKFLPDFSFSLRYFKVDYLKELLLSGVWISVNQMSILLLTQIDLILANIYLSAQDMGELSLTKVVPALIQSIVAVVVGVFVPKFIILYGKSQFKELEQNLLFSIKIVSIVVIIPISFFIVYGVDFFKLYVPFADVQKINLLSILTIIPMIITGSINTIYNVYTVTNKNKLPAVIWLIFGIVNTIIVIVLIEYTSLGVYAIPITALVLGIGRNLLFTPIYGAFCLNLKWNVFYQCIFKGIMNGVVMIVVCGVSKFLFHFIPTSWFYLFLLAVVTGVITLFVSIFINFNKTEISAGISKLKKVYAN